MCWRRTDYFTGGSAVVGRRKIRNSRLVLPPVEMKGRVSPGAAYHIQCALLSMPHAMGNGFPSVTEVRSVLLSSPIASVPTAPAVTAPTVFTHPPLVVSFAPLPALHFAIWV